MGYGRKNKKIILLRLPPSGRAPNAYNAWLRFARPPFPCRLLRGGMASIKTSFEYITISDLRKKNHHRPGFQVRAARVARPAGSRLPLFRDPRFKSGAAAGGRRGAARD